MSNTVIKVENLSKMYHLGTIGYGTMKDDLKSWWANIRGKEDPNTQIGKASRLGQHGEFWALRDVSFDIQQGDRVGIIGRNGAGKSTLLKIMSKITAPTQGSIKVKGRIASLLEVGTGFHAELTGRENIYLNGAILGMKRAEIKSKFDEIVEFAGVSDFIDTPVKRYSSGMYVRLGFSVAAHLISDIMIVDEVLAVGDIAFQKKCIGKMEAVSKEQGKTVLYVSHNMPSISNLCNVGVIMDAGQTKYYGDIGTVMSKYAEIMQNKTRDISSVELNGKSAFIAGYSHKLGAELTSRFNIFEDVFLSMKFYVGKGVVGKIVPNFHFKTDEGMYAFVSNAEECTPNAEGEYIATCKVPAGILNDGTYLVGLAITEYVDNSYHVHFFEDNYIVLNMYEDVGNNPARYGYGGPIPGIARPKLNWTITQAEDKK